MPRQARIIVPQMPHHIVQRGHNRQAVFVQERDYQYYLDNLAEWKQRLGLEVYSYCLMTNHVHLIVQANDDITSIPALMKRLAGRQTRFTNRLENRTGSLWEGRYKVSPVDSDEYLLSCCRYVERNPVKARMVEQPHDYFWSSYSTRIGWASCGWLDVPPAYLALGTNSTMRRSRYKAFVTGRDASCDDELISSAVARNRLTGGKKFIDEVERRTGLRVELRGQGRPRRE